MTNPLLEKSDVIQFDKIKASHAVPAITKCINDIESELERILQKTNNYTWKNLVEPLNELDDSLSRAFGPISHLHSVQGTQDMQEAYEECIGLLTDHSTRIAQHKGLYNALKYIASSKDFSDLSPQQKRSINESIKSFDKSGIGLPQEKQDELEFEVRDENVEEETMKKFIEKNPSKFGEILEQLLHSLSTEKQEGETSDEFSKRLTSEAKKILRV